MTNIPRMTEAEKAKTQAIIELIKKKYGLIQPAEEVKE
jgi:hypothetical protein